MTKDTQPEALRLADELDEVHNGHADEGQSSFSCAASELRRLHAENEALRKDADELSFLKGDLLYWVDRAVSKGNANSDIEDAAERYEKWIQDRHAAMQATK